jgi:hypothetical protein
MIYVDPIINIFPLAVNIYLHFSKSLVSYYVPLIFIHIIICKLRTTIVGPWIFFTAKRLEKNAEQQGWPMFVCRFRLAADEGCKTTKHDFRELFHLISLIRVFFFNGILKLHCIQKFCNKSIYSPKISNNPQFVHSYIPDVWSSDRSS